MHAHYIPRSHASQKRSIHVEHSQKVIETKFDTAQYATRFRSALPWSKHSGSPDCAGIVLKQNNFGTLAMSLHGVFASFYREEFIEITKYKDSQAMYKCLTMVVT